MNNINILRVISLNFSQENAVALYSSTSNNYSMHLYRICAFHCSLQSVAVPVILGSVPSQSEFSNLPLFESANNLSPLTPSHPFPQPAKIPTRTCLKSCYLKYAARTHHLMPLASLPIRPPIIQYFTTTTTTLTPRHLQRFPLSTPYYFTFRF